MATKTSAEQLTEEQLNARTNVAIPMPMSLRLRFEGEAKTADKPLGPYLRDWIADQLGITLPVLTVKRHSKYASEEERKAAQKAAAQKRNEEVKVALAEYRARRAALAAENVNDSAAETPAESEAVPA